MLKNTVCPIPPERVKRVYPLVVLFKGVERLGPIGRQPREQTFFLYGNIVKSRHFSKRGSTF
jgi:hypothetical protein